MDRRSFGKLMAGTVTAAGIRGTGRAVRQPSLQKSPVRTVRQAVAVICGNRFYFTVGSNLPAPGRRQSLRENSKSRDQCGEIRERAREAGAKEPA